MKKYYRWLLLCTLAICILLLSSCFLNPLTWQGDTDQPEEPAPIEETFKPTQPVETPEPTPEPTPTTRGTTRMTLRAVGDILMHMPLVDSAAKADGTYDFTQLFEDIKPYLEGADIVTANLETTISNDEKGYGGYPMFRTPEALLSALQYAGFNLLTTANNHTLDGREFGVHHTLDKLDEYGFLHTGSARSQEERDQVLIVETNDIKAAFLAYTYGTNGMEVTIPEENLPFTVNYIDRDKIEEDIKKAKEAGAEVLIVSIHWGDEYVRTPNSFQVETADFLFSQGVDIILGCHPHVLQPMEKRIVTLEDGTEKEGFIIYSLGNFVSNQRDRYRDSGVIIELEIIKDYDQDTIEIGEITYTPTWVHRFQENGTLNFSVLPVGQFINGEQGLDSSAQARVQEVWAETTEHLGEDGFKIKQ
jgi:poly-gamma-glutamate capsule biosynthesis protein CapA/YwtB (metallophosphatase superfamily)